MLAFSFQAFADVQQFEYTSLPNHVFAIEVVDREEGIVFLTASQKLESGLKILSKIALDDVELHHWYAVYNLEDTPYRISEKDYAIGVQCSNHSRGTGEDSGTIQLTLYHLRLDGLTKIFVGIINNENHQRAWGEETFSTSSKESNSSLSLSSEMTQNHYNLVVTTKIDTSKASYNHDGIKISDSPIYDISTSETATETFVWDGSKYVKAD